MLDPALAVAKDPPGEDLVLAAEPRLFEEMGIATVLTRVGSFRYAAQISAELWVCELDQVLVGHCDQPPQPDALEADARRWFRSWRC